jgi:hypothetical protein
VTYTLVIGACFIAAPATCSEYERPVTGLSVKPSAAFVQAQARVTEWTQKHPGFRLKRRLLLPGRAA